MGSFKCRTLDLLSRCLCPPTHAVIENPCVENQIYNTEILNPQFPGIGLTCWKSGLKVCQLLLSKDHQDKENTLSWGEALCIANDAVIELPLWKFFPEVVFQIRLIAPIAQKWFLKAISKKNKYVNNGHIIDQRAQLPKEITWKGNKDLDATS